MIQALPNTTFYAQLNAYGRTGLAGTITTRIYRVSTASVVSPATTAGITEPEPGIYVAVKTAPDVVGTDYLVIWDDFPSDPAVSEELWVVSTLPSPAPSGGRATSAGAITRVRFLVGDPAGAQAHFTDADIQVALDEHALEVRGHELDVEHEPALGYRAYHSPLGWWEADVEVRRSSGAVLTPTTESLETGTWTFASSTLPPLFVWGRSFDVYGAAADLLEAWAADMAKDVTFTADGTYVMLSERTKQMQAAAERYRTKERPQEVALAGASGGRRLVSEDSYWFRRRR